MSCVWNLYMESHVFVTNIRSTSNIHSCISNYNTPANTQRNKHVFITSKRFDSIITCLLRCVFTETAAWYMLAFLGNTPLPKPVPTHISDIFWVTREQWVEIWYWPFSTILSRNAARVERKINKKYCIVERIKEGQKLRARTLVIKYQSMEIFLNAYKG